jgi:hypothetical protein
MMLCYLAVAAREGSFFVMPHGAETMLQDLSRCARRHVS